MSFIYVASPYTHLDRGVREHRYGQVSFYVASLLKRRSWCYSPIVHCHELAKTYQMPSDAVFWMPYNMAMLSAAREMHVLMLDGWQQSLGVTMEIAFWQGLRHTSPRMIQWRAQ